jgi:hypothetical protein
MVLACAAVVRLWESTASGNEVPVGTGAALRMSLIPHRRTGNLSHVGDPKIPRL